MPTEILYSDKPDADKNVFPIIGKKASETYKEWDTEERAENQCRYRAIFKPDIVKSADAKECAIDFLKSLLRDAKKNNVPLNPLDHRVIFGVPAEANEKYRRMLKQIANEAGFGNVELVEEPKGAMLSDLGHGYFNLADIMQEYLVIDFGGGTCDFAFFQNGVVKHSWGDMHLGGRLLDDLFWQWFREENPDTAKKLIQIGEDFYCRTAQCRETKEWFSETVNGDPNYNGKKKVGDTNMRISNLSKTEFERRARNFKPSQLFLDFQRETGVEMPERLTNGEPFDFIQWFINCLEDGLNEKHINLRDICVVSLAGGSSRWYFIADYCKDVLKIDEKHLQQSPRPYAAISEGLAMLPAIEKEFADKKERINNEKSVFVKNNILSHARSSFERCGKRIADEVVASLFDKRIKPLLLTFRSKGGKVSALETDIAAVAAAYQPQLEQFADKTLSEELTEMFDIAQEKLHEWLREKFGLRLSERQQGIRFDGPKLSGQQDMNIIGGVVTAIKFIVGGDCQCYRCLDLRRRRNGSYYVGTYRLVYWSHPCDCCRSGSVERNQW
jgi:hypothetical protein